MIKNALHLLTETYHHEDISRSAPDSNCNIDRFFQVVKVWEEVAFSDVEEYTLSRYFNYQLKGISIISDTLFQDKQVQKENSLQETLIKLIDHLNANHEQYFNEKAFAPVVYQQKALKDLTTHIEPLKIAFAAAPLATTLRRCMINWLDELGTLSTKNRYTFYALNYTRALITQLSRLDYTQKDVQDELTKVLSRFNFNHLAFLAYRQDVILSEALKEDDLALRRVFYQEQKAAISACPKEKNRIYDPSYPALKTMLTAWLIEQIELTKAAIEVEKYKEKGKQNKMSPKQSLSLSVAHLAFLIKLFLDEQIILSDNTKAVLRFFAANYRTKRQSIISVGSLSKEFYSVDQQTAARVRDMLQKLVARINRNFFPVMAVIGIACLSHPKIC